MKRKITNSILATVLAITTCSTSLFAQNVNIPDANFKAYLLSTNINFNGDSEISVFEAANWSWPLQLWWASNISDLTGIEAFTSITELDCSNHSITSLDVSANTALTHLYCGNNNLTSLITGNIDLLTLRCFNNSLTSLDVSAHTNLTELIVYGNQLTSLNLTANTNLLSLYAGNNQLSSLNLSSNAALDDLQVSNNQLTSLNLSANSNLVRLEAENNQLTSLTLPVGITNLEVVFVTNNQIAGELDFSECPNFWYLGCNNNLINGLNVKNGNNLNFDGFDAIENPNLTCVEVDDAAFSTLWWNIDPTAVFSEDCAALASIESIETRSLSVYPNPASTIVTISELVAGQSLTVIDIAGKVVFQTIVNSSTFDVDVSTIENGMYTIQVVQNGAIAQKKLIVNK